MIKLIIFDLDGVLVDAKNIHYYALNNALQEIECVTGGHYTITEDEHLSIYDGLKTNQKLELLTKNKGLDSKFHKKIWSRKQELTIDAISYLEPNLKLIELFEELNFKGYKLACASNSIRRSVITMLSKIGIIEYMSLILSNEDVKNCKPHPEIYWNTMSIMNVLPEETLIVEDSPIGLIAAKRSNANVLRVDNPHDLTLDKLYSKLNQKMDIIKPKWQNNKMNVIIPMAGNGSRFQQTGYVLPKPLIDVKGKPMIQVVVDNLNIDANFIYIIQKLHNEKYNLNTLLNFITPGCKIVEVDGITEGAACTTLLAKEFINNDEPLLISNSDQYIEWDSNEIMYKIIEQNVDGGILTFEATDSKWSFVKIDDCGNIVEVAEKKPISNIATVGIYYWKKGSDYVKYAEQMIEKNIRTNNEFYVCPVFNEAINDGKKIKQYMINKMWGLGTPEDLNFFLNNNTK